MFSCCDCTYRRHEPYPKRLKPNSKEEQFRQNIISELEDGLKVVLVEGKGKGVVTTRTFAKGDWVCENYGDVITKKEAEVREYPPDVGCFKLAQLW